MTDQRLIEVMQFYAEDAEMDARAFSSSKLGASLLADAALGKAVRENVSDSRIYSAAILLITAIAAELGDES